MATTPLERLLPNAPPGHRWARVETGESTDQVFRRSDGSAYAKLSDRRGAARLEDERRRTEWLAGMGLGSPAVIDWLHCELGACLVTAAVPGVSAAELSGAALSAAWPSICRQLKSLHDVPVADCPFERTLATMFGRAVDVVARAAVNADFLLPADKGTPPAILLANVKADLPARLAQEPGDLVVCHGDACLPNLLVDPETLRCTGMIDLGRLGLADRYADLALLLANASESWSSPADAQLARARLFDIHQISTPDNDRLDFYLRLDPLTWG
ncbi:APH(3'') family aminoglycoside O-phosphotransferase [Chelatococcus reniformis]|uniref:Aminoglycoside 3'-phosphotransferase n=1 Tax=Chelatococcus reniformis TaxID=1494448 RepID=A0A916UNB5_9HYPH|nr:APH(3'') family aminoglycoside O-phosphotransferase [Chelatococcus reniformis]GGC77165.1 APH(3'') family aminoglycoside O-phosphotransferase [Chelatococcus reniformis]